MLAPRGDEFSARSWRHEIAHPIGPAPGMRRGELLICDAAFAYLAVKEGELAELFATLADPDLPRQLDRGATSETAASSGGGSNEALIIGLTGFEPATSPTRTERATRLRHSPNGP